jgi:hypothetical protein
MSEPSARNLTGQLSDELAAARNRGIERLDISSHNQQPLEIPGLDELAALYTEATRSRLHGRIPQLKYLLRDALASFGEENETDAQLVRALFFGDSLHRVTKSAGELLDTAQKESGYTSAVRFRHARYAAFERFAEFLPRFVADTGAVAGAEAEVPDRALSEDDGGLLRGHGDSTLAPEVERLIASTGYIDNGDHFVTLLSQAEKVTIVGHTNETLASMLQLALARKRAAMLRPDSCWSSIRVVFLADDLLDRINDERGYPDPVEARLLRHRLAVYGHRTVEIFLRGLPERTEWAVYDSPHFPPLTGSLLEMPDGRRIVTMVVRRPQRSGSNHLYLELEDTRGRYFSQVFDEIVDGSVDDNKLVPVGRPIDGERFRTTSNRFRRNVLLDKSNARDWLPMVLVITWQMRDGRAEPLLQIRTERNSTRELDRFTHLAGHITGERQIPPGLVIGPDSDLAVATAAQRVQMETGETGPVALTSLAPGRYYHSDKEHLFFFVYSCQLADGVQAWPRAEMSALSVSDLLAIRENQMLRKALLLCEAPPLRRPVRAAAFEIMAQNLILHGYTDLARQVTAARAVHYPQVDAIAAELRPVEAATRTSWPTYVGETEVVGLSGFQFREFFSTLLPFYESVGVPGAAEQLMLIRDDQAKRVAAERLSELYADQRLMESMPIEL